MKRLRFLSKAPKRIVQFTAFYLFFILPLLLMLYIQNPPLPKSKEETAFIFVSILLFIVGCLIEGKRVLDLVLFIEKQYEGPVDEFSKWYNLLGLKFGPYSDKLTVRKENGRAKHLYCFSNIFILASEPQYIKCRYLLFSGLITEVDAVRYSDKYEVLLTMSKRERMQYEKKKRKKDHLK